MTRLPSQPPHLYQEDPAARGTCVHCRLIKKNGAHVTADQLPANPAADIEARRIGERTNDQI